MRGTSGRFTPVFDGLCPRMTVSTLSENALIDLLASSTVQVPKFAVVPCTAAVFSSGVPLDKLNSAVVPSASEARDSWCFPLVM